MKYLGMNRDVHPDKLADGHWVDARNVLYNARRGRLETDEGLTVIGTTTTSDIIGIIPLNEGFVRFTNDTTTSPDTGRIELISETGTTTLILESDELDFSVDRPIRGVFHYNFKGELIIAFWENLEDDANVPRMMNVSCLPFDVTAGVPDFTGKIYLLNQFANINIVNINLTKIHNSGGSLLTGVYYFFVAYGFKDGSETPFFAGSNPVSIYTSDDDLPVTQIDGDASGTQSSKVIELNLTGLNTDFYSIRIGIIKKIDGVESAIKLEPIVLNGSTQTVIYGSDLQATTSSVAEITIPTEAFTRVQAGTIHLNNRLYYDNVKTLAVPDLQPYVNNIGLAWVNTNQIALGAFENSCKDPSIIFTSKNFKSGEVYAFYLIVQMITGAKYAYHIPGRAETTFTYGGNPYNETDTIQDLIDAGETGQNLTEGIDINADAKVYQLLDTSATGGVMAYWENENEIYPDNDCMDIKNAGGAVIGTLRNEKVRHHKFPNLASLETYGPAWITRNTSTCDKLLAHADFDGSLHSWTGEHANLNINSDGGGAWSAAPTETALDRYTANEDGEVSVFVKWALSNHSDTFTYSIIQRRLDGGGTPIQVEIHYQDTVSGGSGPYNVRFNKNIRMTKGDILDVTTVNVSGTGGPNTASDLIEVRILSTELDGTGGLDASARSLGISVTNVNIPVADQANIVSWSIGYAKRSGENITRPAQHVIRPNSFEWDSLAPTRKRTWAFDAMFYKSGIKYDYMQQNRIYLSNVTDSGGNRVDHPIIFATDILADLLFSIKKTFLQPENINMPSDNRGREECLIVDLNSGLLLSPQNYCHVDFGIYRTDMYFGVFKQPIVEIPTHKFAPSTTSGTNIYGGDTFIGLQGTVQTNPDAVYAPFTGSNPATVVTNPHVFFVIPVESITNVCLRHDSHNLIEQYFPHDPYLEFEYATEDPASPGDYLPLGKFTEKYDYNTDYSSVLDYASPLIVQCTDLCADPFKFNHFTTRIYRSILTAINDFSTSWRVFPVNDAYDMPLNKGEAWGLKSVNKKLFIQHEYSLFIAMTKDTLLTNTIEVALGKGDVFTTEPDEVLSSDYGVIGNRHQWAIFSFEGNYVVVDDITQDKTKIYLISSAGSIEEISKHGLEEMFYRKGHVTNGKPDRPFDDSAWTGGFDKKHNRLLFTKHSSLGFGDDGAIPVKWNNFTISYNLDEKFWVSFHTYIPNILFHTRRGLFAVRNQEFSGVAKNRVYLFNSDYNFGFYFNDRTVHSAHNSYIDLVLNDPYEIEKVLQSVNIDVLFDDVFRNVHDDVTITQIMVRNNHQCSGVLTVNSSQLMVSTINQIKKVEDTWHYADFRDIVINRNNTIINDSTDDVQTANLDSGKAFHNQSRFVGKHFIVRIEYDNVAIPSLRMIINNITANVIKSKRL